MQAAPNSRRRLPLSLFVGSLLMLLLVAALMFLGDAVVGPPALNLVGFLAGSVVGVVLLGWFSVVDNRRRATKRYRDWLVPSRLAVRAVALPAWALGILHAFFWALDITRQL